MSEKTIAEQFTDNVRKLRQEQGLSLQELADRAGISKTHVWDIENGNSANPTIATLLALSVGFGCQPSLLLSEFDKAPLHPLAMRVAVDVDLAFRVANGERVVAFPLPEPPEAETRT